VPPDRWLPADFCDTDSHAAGKTDIRWGGFIDGIDRFDAAFFGISPRETLGTSPQQRLLLEVAWHAVENAGIAMPDLASRPQTLGGPRTGVFVGVASFDYYDRVMQAPNRMDGYALTGNAYSVTANRLSYVFDLCGPSIAIDTACSSSLVAIHLACQSLACGESSVALAGGSQVLLSPWVGVAASKGEFLAPDGRCKTFDAGANGYVRGEGIGVVVLKRLDDALRDGDPIWAVVRGTAVNQDGRSNGLTAPNPTAQIDVIGTALQRAGIGADRIGYVEAHGTGTALGDPIEIQALVSVLGDRAAKCFVGSVKTNIGHLEAAAGIAGFIKAVLSVYHGEIVPNLHFKRPNPLIDFDRIPLAVPTDLQRWPAAVDRVAGISSFGFGGTNAHVVIEAPPPLPPRVPLPPLGGPGLLCLSARSKSALAALADWQARWLVDHPQAPWFGVAATAAHGRALFAERLAVVAGTTADAACVLREAASRLRTREADKVRKPGKPRLAVLFTGQGAQYAGMGRGLRDQFPAYAELWRRADAVLVEAGHEPLDGQVHAFADPTNALTATVRAQPALYVLQVGLWRLFRTWGVKPLAVLGHSVGEFAAAHCAGVLSFEQGLRLVARRAEYMQACRPDGAMLLASLNRAAAQSVLLRRASACVIAAVNGPRDVVLSGPIADIEQLAAALRADGITTRRLEVSHAFHSPAMAPAARALAAAAAETAHGRAEIPIFSSMTAAALEHGVDWASYWADQMLKPVDFDGALELLATHKPNLIIELGPRPVLAALAARRFGASVRVVGALDPSVGDLQQLHHVLAACFEAGIDVRAAVPKAQVARERIPGYAFDPQDHPLYPPVAAPHAAATSPHAFLAASTVRVGGVGSVTVTIPLGSRRFPYLGDHTVFGADVLPATGYIELAQAAAYRATGTRRWRLQDLEFRRALVLGADDTDVHVSMTAESECSWRFIVTAGDPPADPLCIAAEEIYSSGVLQALPPTEEQSP
jgi:acyl transferase domain-containing protein